MGNAKASGDVCYFQGGSHVGLPFFMSVGGRSLETA
jgi:hypothetical protein